MLLRDRNIGLPESRVCPVLAQPAPQVPEVIGNDTQPEEVEARRRCVHEFNADGTVARDWRSQRRNLLHVRSDPCFQDVLRRLRFPP